MQARYSMISLKIKFRLLSKALKAFRSFMTGPCLVLTSSYAILIHYTLATLAILFRCFNLPSWFLPQESCTGCYFFLECFAPCQQLVPSSHSDFNSNVTSFERPAHLYVILHIPLPPGKVTIINLC